MSNYASGTRLADLKLVDAPVSNGGAATEEALPSPPSAPPTPHDSREGPQRFLAEATLEFETGHIEQPLWAQAMEKAAGDPAEAKTVYLRARATALQVEKRERRAARSMRRAQASIDEKGQRVDSSDKKVRAVNAAAPSAAPTRRGVALIGAALGSLAIAGALIALHPWDASQGRPDTGRADASAVAPTPSRTTKAVAASGTAVVRRETSGEDLGAKVRELRAAGNWNVLVLYAAEWTRKQPANPEAWKELGRGYLAMRQYRDALDALTKAAQLGPSDFQTWQDLGRVNVELYDAEAALPAFARAVQLNERDVTSLVSIGMLQEQLGHLSDARTAFAAALVISPGDGEALCGAEAVARKEGRLKDADALRRNIDADGRRCRTPDASESTVAVAPVVKKTPARSR
jgi:cytochrome c-type biogenesis protein CcmH/NrfG